MVSDRARHRGKGRAPAPSDRRVVTVLAADIVGSTRHIEACDPEDAQAFLDDCLDHVRITVEREGGILASFEGDGGIAAFGWPDPLEDHADRACRAALDIQGRLARQAPDGRPVRFRVGLHSGLVALKELSRTGRSRFSIAGATVNISAKLCQSAPAGGVVISDKVLGLARASLVTSPFAEDGFVRSHLLKEAAADHRALRLVGRYALPMVGRAEALARVRARLPSRLTASVAVALIGEAGVGKSRLAAAVAAEALAEETDTLVYFGDAQKRTTAFAAARALFAERLALEAVVSREALRQALGPFDLAERDVLVLETLLASPDAKLRVKVSGLTETQTTQSLATSFCMIALDRPLILLIEDLHLVDAESRRFLKGVVEAAAERALLLLVTSRPEAEAEAGQLAEEKIQLAPLSRDEMRQIGKQLDPAEHLDQETLERMLQRADGVPFVLEEFIRAVDAQAGASLHTLPHSLESLIHARFQRLSPAARSLAQALSLLGERVETDLAEAVLGAPAGALAPQFEELVSYAFLHPLSGRTAHMRHQIIAEACSTTIPRQRRIELHQAALKRLETFGAGMSGRFEQLAYHAQGVGDDAAAVGYLFEAGLEARRNSAANSLNLIFDRAMSVIARMEGDVDQQYIEFVLLAFASSVQLGEFEKMNAHLVRAIEIARRQGHPKLVCGTLSQLAMICWFEGRYAEGRRAAEEGLIMARQMSAPALIFSNQIMLTNLLHDMGDVERAVVLQGELCDMLTGELETARLGAAAIPRAMSLSFMSWFLMDVGRYEEGLDYAERGLAVATREADAYSEVLARSALSRNLLMLKRNEEAVECVAVARDLAERYGHDAIKANLAGRIAVALSRTGRAREAVEIVEDIRRKGLHRRTGQLENFYLRTGHAEALFRSGRPTEGLTELTEALRIVRSLGNPCLTAEALDLRAALMLEADPTSPRITQDLDERDGLCRRFGLKLALGTARPTQSA
jgi:class 3 adenylate cyclase/tetratricopeptide (TPR) repeat protein